MIKLEYVRHGVHKGESGAWFSGNKKGHFRQRHQFYSYAIIQKVLTDPEADDPETIWIDPRKDESALMHENDWYILTNQFRKAIRIYHEGLTAAFERADKKFLRQQKASYMFCYAYRDDTSHELVAMFSDGKSSEKITEDDICSYMASKVGINRDTLLASLQDIPIKNGDIFIPFFELNRALIKFEEINRRQPAKIRHHIPDFL